jgi:hypothetical protein
MLNLYASISLKQLQQTKMADWRCLISPQQKTKAKKNKSCFPGVCEADSRGDVAETVKEWDPQGLMTKGTRHTAPTVPSPETNPAPLGTLLSREGAGRRPHSFHCSLCCWRCLQAF